MMKISILILTCCIAVIACTNKPASSDTTNATNGDTSQVSPTADTVITMPTLYSNARFVDVSITKVGETEWRVQGKGQIFEANFGWVVEDGHDELKTGHQMTDAGTPEWGSFDFTINTGPTDPNRTLHLILFESSAEDGSRQHELAIPLK
jgi:hypothetical protein